MCRAPMGQRLSRAHCAVAYTSCQVEWNWRRRMSTSMTLPSPACLKFTWRKINVAMCSTFRRVRLKYTSKEEISAKFMAFHLRRLTCAYRIQIRGPSKLVSKDFHLTGRLTEWTGIVHCPGDITELEQCLSNDSWHANAGWTTTLTTSFHHVT